MSKKIIIFGSTSKITKEIKYIIQCQKIGDVITLGRQDADVIFDANDISKENIYENIPVDADIYIYVIGKLIPKRIFDQVDSELLMSLNVNMIFPVKIVEYLFDKNDKARVFILGSESGKKGSFDTTYFLSKAAIRAYVKEKRIRNKKQQLLLFSPSTIADAGMTIRRSDFENLQKIKKKHPKEEFLSSRSIAKIITSFIPDEFDYITNTEIEINGGKFARM